jgi:hypothetical protein
MVARSEHGKTTASGEFSQVAVEAATGIVISRTIDKNANIHVESKHVDLPDDLANGFVGTLLLDVSQNTRRFGGDAGASQRRAVDSAPNLAGGRADGSFGTTEPQSDSVLHSSGAGRHR